LVVKNIYFLVLNIRRNNIYMYISSISGKILCLKSAGICRVTDRKKLTIESLSILLNSVILGIKQEVNSMSFFLKIDGFLKQELFFSLISLLNKFKLKIMGLLIQSKIRFNGCKLKLR
jgi:hypothetical protein